MTVNNMATKFLSNIKSRTRNFLFKKGFLISRIPNTLFGENPLELFNPVETGIELIRVGSDHDGGYLIPDDLEEIEGVVSPGVGNSSAFELYFAERGIESILADPSVENLPESSALFTFVKKRVSTCDNHQNVSLSTLNKHFSQNGDLVLQMDIEGGEYEILSEIDLTTLLRYRILVIEFHNLDEYFMLIGNMLLKKIMNKLSTYYHIVHVHPNNVGGALKTQNSTFPSLLEVTFIRKDRASNVNRLSQIRHPLDRPCNPDLPELQIEL